MPSDAMSLQVSGSKELVDFIGDLKEHGYESALDGFQNWGDYVYELSLKAAPVDTGFLTSPQNARIIYTDHGFIIIYYAPYAKAVHWGYVRHFIRPKTRKVLRWETSRKDRLTAGAGRETAQYGFSKGHYVPGRRSRSTPNPFLTNSVKKAIPFLKDFVFEELEKKIPEAA